MSVPTRPHTSANLRTVSGHYKKHPMKEKLPIWLKVFWMIVTPGLLLFLGRMYYECIYLTDKYGSQMIGFSLIHNHPGLYIFMILSYFSAILWSIIYIIWATMTFFQNKIPTGLWYFMLVFVSVLVISILLLTTH